jgi:hypothetical protein
MSSINVLSVRILVRYSTLIDLNLSLTTLIDIVGRRKKLLTCTQETTRVKLDRLHSARVIHSDQKTTTRHAMALSKTKGLISLLAHIKYY